MGKDAVQQRHVKCQADFPKVDRSVVGVNVTTERHLHLPNERLIGLTKDATMYREQYMDKTEQMKSPNLGMPKQPRILPHCTDIRGGKFGEVYRGFLNRCHTPDDMKFARARPWGEVPYAIHHDGNDHSRAGILLDENREITTTSLGPLTSWWRHKELGVEQEPDWHARAIATAPANPGAGARPIATAPTDPRPAGARPARPTRPADSNATANGTKLPPVRDAKPAPPPAATSSSSREAALEERVHELEDRLTISNTKLDMAFGRIGDAEDCITKQHNIIEELNRRLMLSIESEQSMIDTLAKKHGIDVEAYGPSKFATKFDEAENDKPNRPLADTKNIHDANTGTVVRRVDDGWEYDSRNSYDDTGKLKLPKQEETTAQKSEEQDEDTKEQVDDYVRSSEDEEGVQTGEEHPTNSSVDN